MIETIKITSLIVIPTKEFIYLFFTFNLKIPIGKEGGV